MSQINARISFTKTYSISEKQINSAKLQPLDEDDLDSWWQTVPGTRRFLKTAVEAVDKHCAAAFHLPEIEIAGFIRTLREKIQRRHFSLSVEVFDYAGGGTVDNFVDALTAEFAPNFLRDFTEDSPVVDFAKQNPCGDYVIIIPLQKKVAWLTSAVTEFNRNTTTAGGSLIFVTSEENPAPSLERLADYLTPYDIQFFAMNLLENSRAISQEKLLYTSTLAAKLAGNSAILAKNLAKTDLYFYGLEFVKTIFPKFDERIFSRAVWECQAQFLLPALERIRGRLIEKNYARLKNILPVKDEFGKKIEEPLDMELRHLHYYGGKYQVFQSGNEWELLELAYTARNDLSHLKTIELLQFERIFALAD